MLNNKIKNIKKQFGSTRVNSLISRSWTHDWDNPIEREVKKKNGYQFLKKTKC